MKISLLLLVTLFSVVLTETRLNAPHRATTHSIFPQIQKEIARMKLPKSFFENKQSYPQRQMQKTVTKTQVQKAKQTQQKVKLEPVIQKEQAAKTESKQLKKAVTNMDRKMSAVSQRNRNQIISNYRFRETSTKDKTVKKEKSMKMTKSQEKMAFQKAKKNKYLKMLKTRRLVKKGEFLKRFKKSYANEVTYGKVTIHIQLPTSNVDELIKNMDYDKENHCVFKEGFMVNVIKTDCNTIWAKPAYILLTPQEFKMCEKAEESSCYSTVKLCEVSHVFTPTDWQSSPCFQIMGKEKDHEGKNIKLAQMCASDYAAAQGWQHAILSYHRCDQAQYKH